MKPILTSTLVVLILSLFLIPYPGISQSWQPTASVPEGGGVTEIMVADNGYIFVATASTDAWPNGDEGGIRRSKDGGDTWENIIDCYTARYIMQGDDGYIYASFWGYPNDESFYRSSNYGDNWEFLTSVPEGNNIFSAAVSPTEPLTTIFAGTRQGVLRSTADGAFFGYSNTGIEEGSWILCMDVDENGIVAAGTTSGYYISEDNGETWIKSEGEIENDTITALQFFSDPDGSYKSKEGSTLYVASLKNGNGRLATAKDNDIYFVATMGAIFAGGELSDIFIGILMGLNKRLLGVTQFPMGSFGLGYYQTTEDNLENVVPVNKGLPSNAKMSSLAGIEDAKQVVKLYAGSFEGMDGGAKVYVLEQEYTGNEEFSNPEYDLIAYPNPFINKVDFAFQADRNSESELTIFNAIGQRVYSIKKLELTSGRNTISWNANGILAGIYYYSLTINDQLFTGKILKN
jgi:hypothetical protein